MKVPKPAATTPTTNPIPGVAPIAPPVAPAPFVPTPEPPVPAGQLPLSTAMVERLFWRAGFGPSAADRATLDGQDGRRARRLAASTRRSSYAADRTTPPPADSRRQRSRSTRSRSDIELELEWIDQMQRAVNPLPDRLAFFWHRHWAVSREEGPPNQWILNYRDRLLRYADLGSLPGRDASATSRTR